jgi:glycosyltransferase involved in cell wall biosynthesis
VHNAFDPGISPWVALAVAVLLSAFFLKSLANYLQIQRLPRTSAERGTPDCMVVIPARNEAASIGRAVRSFPHDTVIVIDDASDDGTAEAARTAGAGVLPAPELGRGAIGKANACLAGASVLTSKWILFTDADTWFKPGFLESAVAYAETNGLSLLSVYLRPEWNTWTERVLAPYGAALYFCGTGPGGDPGAIFNAQCMLVLREAYEFIGGHRAVLHTMVDDVKLAALATRHRLKFGTMRAVDQGHVHLREPREAFLRGAFRFMQVSRGRGIAILMAAGTAALWLPALVWLLLDRRWVAAGIFAALPTIFTLGWYRNPVQALAAPLAIYGMLPIVWRGFFAAFTGRKVNWKGRRV